MADDDDDDLFSWSAKAPPSGHRGGETYDRDLDYVRLNQQSSDVWKVMFDSQWHTLSEVSGLTGHPEASISARLRDFRKPRFGGHTVLRERISGGLYGYRLIPNPEVRADTGEADEEDGSWPLDET